MSLPMYMITVSGEIPLRSPRTRPRFYKKLIDNIRNAIENKGARVERVEYLDAKILVSTDKEIDDIFTCIFGVHRAGKVIEYKFKDLSDLSQWIYDNSKHMVSGKSFAVRVKRSGSHSFTSLDVARAVGTLLKPHALKVDLENPDVIIEVEVRGPRVFLYTSSISGPGGLPIGVEGKAIVLFSGGFDSPVAAWMTAKRGVQVDFLHYVMGSAYSSYNAFRVAKSLTERWFHGYRPRFMIIDFREIALEIAKRVKWGLRQVVLRALMYRVAEIIAKRHGYDVIVTGESIGQASSQTLRNISAVEIASELDVPIMRPLIGFDKEEIISLSRRIGLYDLSSKVAETCAIAPRRVETAAKISELKEELSKIDQSILERALSTLKIMDLTESKPEDLLSDSDIEIDFIPENVVVVDMRSNEERSKRPLNGAICLDNLNLSSLPRDKPIVFVCETGGRSYIMARSLREEGYKAFSLSGGYRRYVETIRK